MDYATAQQVFFGPAPEGTPVPYPWLDASPARRLRDAVEPLATHFAWSRHVNERLAAHGLNFLTGYVWGRAAPLGEPVGAVVASAFAAFDPGLIASLYEEGRSVLPRDQFLQVQEEAVAESLRAILGDADVGSVVSVLQRGVAAADGTGRPMFSGIRALGLPADPMAQLWRSCQAVREHRGDSHIAVYTSAGFDPVQMNILTELWVGWRLGEFSGTRAWNETRTVQALGQLRTSGLVNGDSITDEGRRVRGDIEERTDRLEQQVVEALGDDLQWVVERLTEWSNLCKEAGDFPPNPLKHAAG